MDERFENIRRAADSHFWYYGFRRFISDVLTDVTEGRSGLRIIDCGCGIGQNMPLLAQYGRPVGFEHDPLAAAAGLQFGRPIVRADISRIPFRDNVFDLAVSFAVLQFVETDLAAVREIARVIRPGGHAVLFMTALDVLAADHSEIWKEFRRYTPRTARALAESAGLHVDRVSFLFATLFPLMLTVRTVQRLLRPWRPAPSQAEVETPPKPINSTLKLLLDGEAALSRHVPMPVGSSLIVIARKDG
jgi:SAM-dependent methyltransferase